MALTKRFSDQDELAIIEAYHKFRGAEKVAKVFNTTKTTILKILNGNNIPLVRNIHFSFKNIPQVDKDHIIALNADGFTIAKIVSQTKYTQNMVYKVLLENKTEFRTWSKYKVNENFFDIIDNEANAYFLGLMYADGNVHKTCMVINLQERDKSILETFRDLITPDRPLAFRDLSHKKHKNQWVLAFSNVHITQQLIKLGCMPAKSLILKFPTFLLHSPMLPHFIRGYMDGDGSIKGKGNSFMATCTSTRDFNTELARIIEQTCDIHPYHSLHKPKTKNKITTVLSIGGNRQVKRFLEWIYKDATIYLDRKYERFQKLLKHCAEVDAKFPNRHYK